MTRTGRLLTAALVLAVVLLLLAPLLRRARRQLALEPVGAWVAIERADSGVAEVGFFELEPEEPFTLHAVLEARRGQRRLYFTEAGSLTVDGEPVAAEDVAPWKGDLEAQVLWFTLESQVPVVRTGEAVPRLRYQANFRADWPRAWRAPGKLDPYRRRLMEAKRQLEGRFGTQRYQVRIELFGTESAIRPRHRVTSSGPDSLLTEPEAFPGAVVGLEGVLAPASRVFGLPQIVGELDAEGLELARRWQEDGLAFTLPLLLREMAAIGGRRWEQLRWETIDPADGPAWGGAGVAPGDLIRVGSRVVVLYLDEGVTGRFDGADLCFDYLEGPSVERIGDVFTGEGLVEWAGWPRGAE